MTNDDLADILRSALSGTQLNTDINIRRIMEYPGESADLFNLASSHSVANVVSIGLLNNGINPEGTPYEQAEFRAAFSDAQIEVMMSFIRSTFEARHITFIPLKGLVLKQFYPESSMRTCGDVDILVKEEQIEDAVNLLVKECGYKVESYNYHDVALVTPEEQAVELHFSVLYDIEKLDAVLSQVWDYTVPIVGKCEMKLTDDFFLFFILAHMFHHFVTGGCGIRFFMDLWVIKHRMGIEYENGARVFCIEAGIDKFAATAIQLSEVWFGENCEHTELTKAMEEYILSGGTFGSAENNVATSGIVKQTDRFQYNIKRMLLPYKKLKLIYPEMKGYLFFVVREGSGWLEYNGQHYELSKGSAVFIDCRKGYSQSSSEALWHLSWCHWSGNNMSAVYNKWTERGGKPVFHLDDPVPFVSLLDELYATASSEDFVRDIHINEHLTKLVSLLMEQTVYDENKVYQDGAVASDKITTGADRIDVGEVKSYIDSHYKETLSLEGLADQFFVNKNYLARLFKEMFGVSVGGYIQLVRIGKAKELLRFTDISVEKIAYECGYNDLNYFSRVFKKVEGCSPSEFRRNWMSGSGKNKSTVQ